MGSTQPYRLIVWLVAIAGGLVTGAPAFAQSVEATPSLGLPVQTSRLSLDAVVAVDGGAGSDVTRKPTGWFDLFGAMHVSDRVSLRARPVVFRRLFDGSWHAQMYELALRYERPGAVGVRVDVGQFVSSIGLAILENRPNRNPVISQHSTLYLPVVRYEPGTPSTNLIAASYPLGAQVTASTGTWDVRAAVIDSSPIRSRPLFGDNLPPRMMNVVAGGGVTPRIGLRLGAAVSHGSFALAREVRDQSAGDRSATVIQGEAEWSFGYTRVAGEYLWTRREMASGSARVDGGWVEVTQTLNPRWFVAARYDDQYTSWTSEPDLRQRHEPYRRLETTAGYRVLPELTLRASYMTRKGYAVGFWDDQMLVSAVFAKKIR
ncbi:MAG: hypothetical protein Q8T13_21755 [Acidobacteriota bacterium]|nr:hypothetical protein [Acidobacteriota bacterium]